MTSAGSNGHCGNGPAGARQHRSGARRKPQVAVEPALEFEQQRRTPGDEIDNIAERQHALPCGLVGGSLQGRGRKVAQ
jgi:hypothetical protein